MKNYIWDYEERFLYIMEIIVAMVSILWVLYLTAGVIVAW